MHVVHTVSRLPCRTANVFRRAQHPHGTWGQLKCVRQTRGLVRSVWNRQAHRGVMIFQSGRRTDASNNGYPRRQTRHNVYVCFRAVYKACGFGARKNLASSVECLMSPLCVIWLDLYCALCWAFPFESMLYELGVLTLLRFPWHRTTYNRTVRVSNSKTVSNRGKSQVVRGNTSHSNMDLTGFLVFVRCRKNMKQGEENSRSNPWLGPIYIHTPGI